MSRKKPYPVTDLTGGLNVAIDPFLLEDKDFPEILEVRHDKGLLKKDFGLATFATPILGIPLFIDKFYLTDGTAYNICVTTTSVYKLDTDYTDWVDVTKGVMCDNCASGWTASTNVTVSHPVGMFGANCVKLAIGADFTTGLAGYKNISSANYTAFDHIHLFIKSSKATAVGDLQILLDDTNACASPLEAIDIPALVANVRTRVSLTLASPAALTAVLSVGLKVITDLGAIDVYLDEIQIVKELTGTADNPVFSTTFVDNYIIVNGCDPPLKWDGTGVFEDLGGSPPTRAATVCTFMNHLIFGNIVDGGTSYPFRVKWSDVGTIETWSGGTSGYVDLVDTIDWIMHMKLLGEKCIVYKDYSIWELTYVGGSQVFKPEMKINTSGTRAPNTIVDLGATHILFSEGNIIEFDGTYAPSIADSIVPLLYETGSNIINLATIARANSLFVEETQTYILSFPYEKVVFKFDYKNKSWIRFNSKDWCALGYYTSGTATPIIWSAAVGAWEDSPYGSWKKRALPTESPTVLIGSSTGQLYEDDRVTTSSNELIWVTKDFLFEHASRITEVRVLYRYGGFTIYYSIDQGASYISLGSFAYSTAEVEGVKTIDITAQKIRFKITTSVSAIELKWLEPWYIPRARSKSLVKE